MQKPSIDLQEAAAVLDALAAGDIPDKSAVVNAALILSSYCQRTHPDRDMLDAARGLELLASGRELNLDAVGCERARKLALIVRKTVL